jgi:membrane protease YdiL (CAAX protease family)
VAPDHHAYALLAVAAAVSVAASYVFSRLCGELAERWTFPVGAPAVVLGFALTLGAPCRFGWQWGRTAQQWRLVTGCLAAVTAVVLGYRLLVGAAPYEPTLAEVVVVPVGEEALFRGFLLTTLVLVLGRSFPEPAAARLAIVLSATAFAVGHLGNIGYVPTPFVLLQVGAALAFGLLAGWVRVRTQSLAGPVLLHMAMNAAATV